jgi:hypothetical protein
MMLDECKEKIYREWLREFITVVGLNPVARIEKNVAQKYSHS